MNVLVPLSVLAGAAIIAHTINRRSEDMTAALDRLVAEVAETRGVAASAVAALSAIPQLIRDAVAAAVGDAAGLETKLNELADDLDATQADLTGAINQNPGPADPGGDTVADTAVGGDGEDTVEGGDGNDVIDG